MCLSFQITVNEAVKTVTTQSVRCDDNNDDDEDKEKLDLIYSILHLIIYNRLRARKPFHFHVIIVLKQYTNDNQEQTSI